MNDHNISLGRAQESVLATNKVLKNTYLLLSMTLIFSGVMAAVSMAIEPPRMIGLFTFIGAIALLFVLNKTANSPMGIAVVFGITGLLGFGLGPMLNSYMQLSNGGELITTALGGTGIIFLGLSGYALTSRRDFSFMGGMLFVGLIVAFLLIIANLFMNIPAFSLAISALIILVMSGFILYDTSRIIHGGETNYVMATVSLYLNIYNIFVHLLSLLGVLGGDD